MMSRMKMTPYSINLLRDKAAQRKTKLPLASFELQLHPSSLKDTVVGSQVD